MNKVAKIFIIIFFIFLVGPNALSAELFFYSPQKDWSVNFLNNTSIGVYINTQEEIINTIAGEIVGDGVIEITGVSLGNSIVPLWIEKPKLIGNNTIRFAGMIPGGLQNYSGLLFKFIIKNNQTGSASLHVNEFTALLHDGLGTSATTSTKDFNITILPREPGTEIAGAEADVIPPEDFKPVVVSDQNLMNGSWVVVFQTQDKDSGVDYYKIQETRDNRLLDKNWQIATSPYILKDQALRSYIYVKAVDRAGNEILKVIPPQQPLAWWEDYYNWVIIVIGGVLPLIILLILWRKIIKH